MDMTEKERRRMLALAAKIRAEIVGLRGLLAAMPGGEEEAYAGLVVRIERCEKAVEAEEQRLGVAS